MKMNMELHPRSDFDKLYVSKMEGGRGLTGLKICAKAERKVI